MHEIISSLILLAAMAVTSVCRLLSRYNITVVRVSLVTVTSDRQNAKDFYLICRSQVTVLLHITRVTGCCVRGGGGRGDRPAWCRAWGLVLQKVASEGS